MRVGYGYDDNLRFDESVDNDMMVSNKVDEKTLYVKDHRRISKNEVNKVITICVYRIRVKKYDEVTENRNSQKKASKVDRGGDIHMHIYSSRKRKEK